MKKVSLTKLTDLFKKVSESMNVYAPIEKADKVNFDKWDENSKVRLDELKTVKSAKDLFFPQIEDIATFTRNGKNVTVEAADGCNEKFVIFGVRACDAASFKLLDKVFLADPVDTYYQARRENGIIVSLACGEPEESCFCKVFGIDATQPDGDVIAWIVDDTLYLKENTEKGKEFMAAIASFTEDSDEAKVEEARKATKEIIEKLPNSNLDVSMFTGDTTDKYFNSPKWEELYKACLGCGTCTFVCPTCQCYDIRDYDNGHGIQRFRCWDSCMRSDFTLMASGNPRTSQLERFRQRFMHKLVYFPANNDGAHLCVGCGRCLDKCPVSLNIVKVIKALGEEK